MKNVVLVFVLGFVSLFLLYSFGNGPAKRNHDKTGSPLSDGKCMQCHSAGKFGVNLEIKMFDGDQEVTEYVPGHTYKFQYEVKHTGNPSKYGFQTVFLDSENNGVGTFDSIRSGFQVSTLNNVDYVEHSSPRSLEFMNFDWTAPVTGVGDITIYFGGIAANGNGGTGGDGGQVTSMTLKESTTSSTELVKEDIDFYLLNNPVSDRLRIMFSNFDEEKQVAVYSISGNRVFNAQTDDSEIEINAVNLPKGLYITRVIINNKVISKKFIKL